MGLLFRRLAVRTEDGQWREFNTKDGLLYDPCWSLAALPNGDVWYGYFNAPAFALLRPRPDGQITVRQYRARDGVIDPEARTLNPDQRGWLWRGGKLGMSVADPEDAEAAQWLHFDQSDGLPAEEVNTGSYFADLDGSSWWGTENNIVHYTPPPDLVRPQFAPQVFLSAFSYDNNPPRLAEAVADLPHGRQNHRPHRPLQPECKSPQQPAHPLPPPARTNILARVPHARSGAREASRRAHIRSKFKAASSPARGLGTASRPFSVLRPVGLSWPLLTAYLPGRRNASSRVAFRPAYAGIRT